MFQFLHVDKHTNKTKSNPREESTLKSCYKATGANENRFQFLAKSEKLLCSYFRPQKPNLVHRTVIPSLVGYPQLKSRMRDPGNKVFLQFGSKTKEESWELGFPQVTVRRLYQESLTYHALPHMSNFIKRTL